MTSAAWVERQSQRRVSALITALGPLGIACATVIVVVILIAVAAPLLAPHDPNATDPSNTLAGPSLSHPLGTDEVGRDLLSRLIYGARTSLLGPLLVTMLATAIASLVSIWSAWRGGSIDSVIGRGLDILFAFPGVLLAILAVVLFGRGLHAAVIALGIAYIPYIARTARSAALKERAQAYVSACRAQGYSGFRICMRHLLPNVSPILVATSTLAFGYAMVDLAAVSFLGLGVQPPTADWGVMIGAGRMNILQGHPEQSLLAGTAIVVVVAAFTLLGERLSRLGELGGQ